MAGKWFVSDLNKCGQKGHEFRMNRQTTRNTHGTNCAILHGMHKIARMTLMG